MCSWKGSPDCCVPSRSPGPRSCRSASAIRNPSLVCTMISIRRRVSLESCSLVMRIQ